MRKLTRYKPELITKTCANVPFASLHEHSNGAWYHYREVDARMRKLRLLQCEGLINICTSRAQLLTARILQEGRTEEGRKKCFLAALRYEERAESLRKIAAKLKEEPHV